MPTSIFVNLPVRDLKVSKAFFTRLGYSFDPQFTTADAACLVISDTIYAMLHRPESFARFTQKDVADARNAIEVILALSADSREAVDELADRALASGGSHANDPMDYGNMYGRSFHDPDGHMWEVVYLEPDDVE
ncbi:VOC family protein [Allonocardiopsis opalescens]|uniref:VOC domain-containing protein n=1 Tax=Allonocardiopsis opalescens TaxID=1144618 RepID=A0A2T0PV72_9ACTN|nr:VOC family protein [Allonocardiopsis opalescens]PRX95434.1 hypothetical protein CLV72_10941 [Allonocardiopsis opalescens]